MLVIEEHLDSRCNFFRTTIVDRGKNPRGFGEHEMRNPSSTCDECLGCGNLLGVIPRDKPDENVRVNGPHSAS
jgi:hypothetical protein